MRTSIFLAAAGAALTVGACAHGNDGDVGLGGAGATTTGAAAPTTASGSTASNSTSGDASSTATATGSSVVSSSASSNASSGSGMGTLFFSEYVEGTSSNKALELFNGGGASVDLSDCEIARFQNGAATAAMPPLALDAMMLGPGQTFVVCNTSFSQTGLCDQIADSVQHTGNDVVEIVCNGQLLDAFGRVGEDAVWGTAPTTSMEATLRRKCAITVGDTNPSNAFDPATEWTGFPVNSFSDLGQHVCP